MVKKIWDITQGIMLKGINSTIECRIKYKNENKKKRKNMSFQEDMRYFIFSRKH